MGRLTEDMARLRQNIEDQRVSRQDRQAGRTAELHVRVANVNALMSDFASVRVMNAQQDAQAREAYVNALMSDFASVRVMNAQQDAQAREAFVSSNIRNVADLLDSFNAVHKETSQEVARLLESMQFARIEQAHADAKERADFFSDLANSISQFLAETKSLRMSDAATAAAERKSNVAALIGEVAEDRRGAREAFFTTANVGNKTEIVKPARAHAPPKAVQVKTEMPPPVQNLAATEPAPANPEVALASGVADSAQPDAEAPRDEHKTNKKNRHQEIKTEVDY